MKYRLLVYAASMTVFRANAHAEPEIGIATPCATITKAFEKEDASKVKTIFQTIKNIPDELDKTHKKTER